MIRHVSAYFLFFIKGSLLSGASTHRVSRPPRPLASTPCYASSTGAAALGKKMPYSSWVGCQGLPAHEVKQTGSAPCVVGSRQLPSCQTFQAVLQPTPTSVPVLGGAHAGPSCRCRPAGGRHRPPPSRPAPRQLARRRRRPRPPSARTATGSPGSPPRPAHGKPSMIMVFAHRHAQRAHRRALPRHTLATGFLWSDRLPGLTSAPCNGIPLQKGFCTATGFPCSPPRPARADSRIRG